MDRDNTQKYGDSGTNESGPHRNQVLWRCIWFRYVSPFTTCARIGQVGALGSKCRIISTTAMESESENFFPRMVANPGSMIEPVVYQRPKAEPAETDE